LFPKLDELESVSSRIAALETSIHSPAERISRDAELAELARRRDELDEELSQLSAAYREQKEQSRPVLADIQKLLNSEEVLVDLKEFNAVDERGDEAWRVAAFVIRADAPIRLVVFDRGSAVNFGSLVTEWRKTLGRTAKARQAGLKLFREFWSPLLLADAKTVLLSPEGALARFPFAALPDETPDRYLIERIEVAVVPATSMLPELLQIDADEDATSADLLLVGGVDYGESSNRDIARREGARSADAKPFENLPNSGDEVRRIEQLFRAAYRERLEVELLDQAEATESRFRIAAPRATFIHLAVHGFQSFRRTSPTANTIAAGRLLAAELNASGRSVGVHPGLLCGVALAGANSPATLEDRLADDGLLTGLEVSNLDLSSSRMVVLSACESGIGEVAAGEGMLTLQRAFAVAGARTTISTLWPVYDDVTAALMVEFYQEMLKTDEPNRPLTALCAAQRAVLDHYDPATRQVRRSIKKPANDTTESEEAQRLPPVYWAGFMLSGRWR
jgi:CHAT domain-containing protein